MNYRNYVWPTIPLKFRTLVWLNTMCLILLKICLIAASWPNNLLNFILIFTTLAVSGSSKGMVKSMLNIVQILVTTKKSDEEVRTKGHYGIVSRIFKGMPYNLELQTCLQNLSTYSSDFN